MLAGSLGQAGAPRTHVRAIARLPRPGWAPPPAPGNRAVPRRRQAPPRAEATGGAAEPFQPSRPFHKGEEAHMFVVVQGVHNKEACARRVVALQAVPWCSPSIYFCRRTGLDLPAPSITPPATSLHATPWLHAHACGLRLGRTIAGQCATRFSPPPRPLPCPALPCGRGGPSRAGGAPGAGVDLLRRLLLPQHRLLVGQRRREGGWVPVAVKARALGAARREDVGPSSLAAEQRRISRAVAALLPTLPSPRALTPPTLPPHTNTQVPAAGVGADRQRPGVAHRTL